MIRNEIIISLSPASPQFVGVWSPDCVHHNIIIPVPLSQSVIKCNFPSFQLERMVIPLRYSTHVQTRPGMGWDEKAPGCQTPVSWLVTWDASVTRTLSLCHVITSPATRFRLSRVTETQLRSGKWYLSIMGHGTDWGWSSGNALQIGGTMPGLPGHHYTIINSMSLCEEIWIMEMASHPSLLTAPWCVLRVPPRPIMTVMTSDQYY